MLYFVTATGFVTPNVAYELTTALKERFVFVCRVMLHRNVVRDLRTAVHSYARFVSFGFCCTTDICRVCMTFRERKFLPPLITSFRKLILRRDIIIGGGNLRSQSASHTLQLSCVCFCQLLPYLFVSRLTHYKLHLYCRLHSTTFR